MTVSPRRVAIVGAGAIGLSIAWRLLQRGARVTVYDRGPLGRGASWASAGLLAATAGHGGPAGTPLDALCRRALGRWDAFARELTDAAGIDVVPRSEGTLVVALDAAEAERLGTAYEAWRAAGDDAQRWLARDVVARLEPALAGTVVAARLCPNDRQVDARRLVAALAEAVRRAGGAVREHTEVDVERVDADVVVLAAGAWSGSVPGAPSIPIAPLKGQMVALRPTPGVTPLRHVVFTRDVYLVPRPGRLLVGATSEARGFDTTVTAGSVRLLLDGARRAVPTLDDAPLDDAWAGVRPMTLDGAPLLGRLTERIVVATGHGRNGILLTPVTAEAITALVLDGALPSWALGFGMERFG
ncbi:glycine oxidase ThiO [Gemmatirosa kalamazoonensis]|uniref:Glycine oxidase ThiO n=2 Tax=Gemmatirosa kalamazoonensis TaxID=861299 RepID=W0REM1_9BACT|nr:glycine oxidase ThiO [Gemmatirosa kalamazoonensis]AHG88770.1 glycine oxidase ThiO [Gemmatirosa kalamazoonensis]